MYNFAESLIFKIKIKIENFIYKKIDLNLCVLLYVYN